ncbi:MAG: hypothetical protein WCO23_04285, partial [bacterium]
KTVDKKFTDFDKKDQEQTTNIVTNKLKSVFEQIGDIFNNGLIKPIMALFLGIGNIFIQLFNILTLIVGKLISLPSCLFTYIAVEFFNIIYNSDLDLLSR